ncbi:MAG: hypothetical protein HQK51_02095 [Oligoflexia bacterium]|nr:hypothetical protein [Oligoflexia bacterium]
MNSRITLFILFSLFSLFTVSSSLYGETLNLLPQGWNLKGALGVSATHMRTHGRTPKKWHTGFDFASSIGYRFRDFDFAMASYVTITKSPPVYIRVGNATIDSDYGVLMSLTFGPKITHYLTNFNLLSNNSKSEKIKKLYPFIIVNPVIAIQSLYFERGNITSSDPRSDFYMHQKLTYEGIGYICGFGVDIINLYSQEFFVEVLYKYLESSKMSVIGGTKKEVKTLYVDENKRSVKEHTIILLVGLRVM